MKRLETLIAFLGSRTLTLWVAMIGILYYLSVAVWSKEAFAAFIINLAENNLFRFGFLLFWVNIAIRMAAALRRLWPVKTAFYLRFPLYVGLLIFLLSFFMSLNVRDFRWMVVGEGDVIEVPWEDTPFRVLHIEPAIKRNAIVTADSPIFAYEPSLTAGDRFGQQHRVGAFPPIRVRSSYMHILNFGIGPGIELREGGEVLRRGEVALRLIPFGSVDSFEIQPLPYKVYMSVLPNRVLKKGKETARDYDLTKPLYHVEIVKGDRTIAKGDTAERIAFDGDLSLAFFTPADWVHLEIVYDPFRAWFLAGLALLLTGLILYPFSLFALRSNRLMKEN